MMARTLEPVWLTPTRRTTFVLGYSLAGLAVSTASGCVLLGVGSVFFGARFFGAMLTALPALGLAEVGLLGMTFMVAAATLLMKEPNFFVDSSSFAFSAASGISFPISILPGAL